MSLRLFNNGLELDSRDGITTSEYIHELLNCYWEDEKEAGLQILNETGQLQATLTTVCFNGLCNGIIEVYVPAFEPGTTSILEQYRVFYKSDANGRYAGTTVYKV